MTIMTIVMMVMIVRVMATMMMMMIMMMATIIMMMMIMMMMMLMMMTLMPMIMTMMMMMMILMLMMMIIIMMIDLTSLKFIVLLIGEGLLGLLSHLMTLPLLEHCAASSLIFCDTGSLIACWIASTGNLWNDELAIKSQNSKEKTTTA